MNQGVLSTLLFVVTVAVTEAFWSPDPNYHTCCASGDPHNYLYDGGVIHFQGTCRYLLTGTCPCSALEPFHVYVENEQHPFNPAVSVTKVVEIHYNGWIVQFNRNGIVNVRDDTGVWSYNVATPYPIPGGEITKPSWNHMVFENDEGITVEFMNNHHVCVHVPCKYEDELCGICGNMNNVNDDYVTSDGVDVSSDPNKYTLIGNSWQVVPPPWSELGRDCHNQATASGVNDAPVQTQVDTSACDRMRELLPQCVIVLGELFNNMHESCRYDLQALEGVRGAHCQTIETFINRCEALLNIEIDWRRMFGCPCPNGSYNDPCPASRGIIGAADFEAAG